MNTNKQHCHSGVDTRTMWMHNGTQQHDLLQHVIEKQNAFVMRIVKNSSGAEYATFLILMHEKKNANSSCSCYGPPGGLYSYELATCCS